MNQIPVAVSSPRRLLRTRCVALAASAAFVGLTAQAAPDDAMAKTGTRKQDKLEKRLLSPTRYEKPALTKHGNVRSLALSNVLGKVVAAATVGN